MELKNHMEQIVLQKLDGVLKQYPNCCTCERCRNDIVCLALNHLPPKYICTDKGTIFARIEEMSSKNSTEVISQLAKAVEVVSQHPRHGEAH